MSIQRPRRGKRSSYYRKTRSARRLLVKLENTLLDQKTAKQMYRVTVFKHIPRLWRELAVYDERNRIYFLFLRFAAIGALHRKLRVKRSFLEYTRKKKREFIPIGMDPL